MQQEISIASVKVSVKGSSLSLQQILKSDYPSTGYADYKQARRWYQRKGKTLGSARLIH